MPPIVENSPGVIVLILEKHLNRFDISISCIWFYAPPQKTVQVSIKVWQSPALKKETVVFSPELETASQLSSAQDVADFAQYLSVAKLTWALWPCLSTPWYPATAPLVYYVC